LSLFGINILLNWCGCWGADNSEMYKY
jgi:hypothetical protein